MHPKSDYLWFRLMQEVCSRTPRGIWRITTQPLGTVGIKKNFRRGRGKWDLSLYFDFFPITFLSKLKVKISILLFEVLLIRWEWGHTELCTHINWVGGGGGVGRFSTIPFSVGFRFYSAYWSILPRPRAEYTHKVQRFFFMILFYLQKKIWKAKAV